MTAVLHKQAYWHIFVTSSLLKLCYICVCVRFIASHPELFDNKRVIEIGCESLAVVDLHTYMMHFD